MANPNMKKSKNDSPGTNSSCESATAAHRHRRTALTVLAFLLFAATFVAISLALDAYGQKFSPKASVASAASEKRKTVVVDAGHGGEDGGAIGANGVYEKDLNLALAEDLRVLLSLTGANVVPTRIGDVALYDEEAAIRGQKKASDLAARLKIAEDCECDALVSIHMNSFPDAKYYGLQVYYSPNAPESLEIAKTVAATNRALLQSDNRRDVKPSGGRIFLLDRIKRPAVMVECGFISNPRECELLCSDNYRRKLAQTLFFALCESLFSDEGTLS